jgi:hypothetical protein
MRNLLSLLSIIFMSTAMFAQSSWKQLAEVAASNGAQADWFGLAAAANSDTLAVTDFDPNLEAFGSVDVFVKPSSGWANMTQSATLIPSDQGEGFGASVAISEDGNLIVVGAAVTSNFASTGRFISPATTPGAVYVYQKPANGWSGMLIESQKLRATDGQAGDAFGSSVSVSRTIIAVGAFFANNFAGRVYVFSDSENSFSQTAELTASDGGMLSYLGGSVAINQDQNVIAAGSIGQNNFQGAVYVFVASDTGWHDMTQTAELTAPSNLGSNNLGQAVALSANGATVVAGEPGARNAKGAVCIYLEPSAGWKNTTQPNAGLAATDAIEGDSFGGSVAITPINDTAVLVGAPGQNVGANLEQGAAYLFLKPKSGWKSTKNAYQEFIATDGAQADLMGSSVAIAGTNAVAGAPKSAAPGAAYVFGK